MAVVSLLSAIFITGCSMMGSPKKPVLLNTKRLPAFDYTNPKSPDYYLTKYNAASKDATKREARNRILNDLMALIDYNYHEYEATFRGDKSIKDTSADIVTLALTATATAAGGEEVKTILSAIATGVVGINTSLDKNFFQNNTVQVLELEMRSLRSEYEKRLIDGMALSDANYPLESGIRDVIAYYYAGSLTDALLGLVGKTGTEAETNKANAAAARANLPKQ